MSDVMLATSMMSAMANISRYGDMWLTYKHTSSIYSAQL